MPTRKSDRRKARQLQYREEWLTELARKVEPIFDGLALTPYRVTCGWPVSGGLGRKVRVLGECHSPRSSQGGISEIFVSPTLADGIVVAGTLVHEMAHVAAGHDAKHGPKFVKVCKHVGLTKHKPTSAAPGELLTRQLEQIITKLGPYPHHAIVGVPRPQRPLKDVTMYCPACGCRVRMTVKWLLDAGQPSCGCGAKMELALGDDNATPQG